MSRVESPSGPYIYFRPDWYHVPQKKTQIPGTAAPYNARKSARTKAKRGADAPEKTGLLAYFVTPSLRPCELEQIHNSMLETRQLHLFASRRNTDTRTRKGTVQDSRRTNYRATACGVRRQQCCRAREMTNFLVMGALQPEVTTLHGSRKTKLPSLRDGNESTAIRSLMGKTLADLTSHKASIRLPSTASSLSKEHQPHQPAA